MELKASKRRKAERVKLFMRMRQKKGLKKRKKGDVIDKPGKTKRKTTKKLESRKQKKKVKI